jgi:hypothetical protein
MSGSTSTRASGRVRPTSTARSFAGTSSQDWARYHSVSSTQPLCVSGAQGCSKPGSPRPWSPSRTDCCARSAARDLEHGGHRGGVDHRQPVPDQRRWRGKGQRAAGVDLDQLNALVDLMPDRWKAFLLLKTFASLRWGEITALTRNDLDLERRTVRIRRQFLTMPGGLQLGPPKSRPESAWSLSRPASWPNSSTTWTPTLSPRLGRVGVCQRARAAVASRKLQPRSPLAGGP